MLPNGRRRVAVWKKTRAKKADEPRLFGLASLFWQEGVQRGANLMDAYLLARMFRDFGKVNHPESNLKIVLAGAQHIDNYVEFFEKHLNLRPSKRSDFLEPTKKEGRCVPNFLKK